LEYQWYKHQFSVANNLDLPFGNFLQFANLKPWPIEFVDLPIKHGGSFHRFLYVDQAGYPFEKGKPY
jgi:hypothetical protein